MSPGGASTEGWSAREDIDQVTGPDGTAVEPTDGGVGRRQDEDAELRQGAHGRGASLFRS